MAGRGTWGNCQQFGVQFLLVLAQRQVVFTCHLSLTQSLGSTSSGCQGVTSKGMQFLRALALLGPPSSSLGQTGVAQLEVLQS